MVNLRRTGLMLKAHCHDGMRQPLRLLVQLSSEGIIHASCTCSMGSSGRCKHIAALLLIWLEKPTNFLHVESLELSLDLRSKAELGLCIRQLIHDYPDLETRLELPRLLSIRPSERELIRQYVWRALKSVEADQWRASDWVAAELNHILRLGREFLNSREWYHAATLYEVVARELMAEYKRFNDELGQLYDIIERCVLAFGSCLSTIIVSEKREQIFRVLFDIYLWEVNECGINQIFHQPTYVMRALSTRQEKELIASWAHERAAKTGQTEWQEHFLSQFGLGLTSQPVDMTIDD
jgi:hypothetical protein